MNPAMEHAQLAGSGRSEADGARRLRQPVLWICRVGVAMTWLYNGLWLKLLDEGGQHAVIVAQASGASKVLAGGLAFTIGILECALAALVLLGWRPWWICAIQITALTAMNTGGILLAGSLIDDIPALLVRNLAFVNLIVATAYLGDQRRALQT